MSEATLFDTAEKPAALSFTVKGYMLACDVTELLRSCDQVVVPKWHLDVESFRETVEAVEKYNSEWGDDDTKIVAVTINAQEPA